MYEFAIVVLLGIGTFKLVDMLNEYVDLSKVQTLLTIALGAVVAWALGFSIFALWDVPVRSETVGYIGTGLMIAGMALACAGVAMTGLMIAAAGYATPKVFEHVGEVIGHRRNSSLQKAA